MRKLPGMSEATRRLNAGIVVRGIRIREPEMTRVEIDAWLINSEGDLQALCEEWLERRGYARLTRDGILGGGDRGYQLHLHACQKNPFLLDITLFGNDGRYLMVELKHKKGRMNEHQAAMVHNNRNAHLIKEFADFEALIKEWETL
ncbi:MAG: hypothetical protein EOM12_05715 [Verrucomicrobiae bacterium]|nr:hypothetical protein [Verrucomicrobiae bacterium]